MVLRTFVKLGHNFSRRLSGRPALDFEYLLDFANRSEITANIKRRKQIGDLDALYQAWNDLQPVILEGQRPSDVTQLENLWDKLYDCASSIPNKTHPDAPTGDESNAVIVKEFGSVFDASVQRIAAEELGHRFGSYFPLTDACGDRSYSLIGPLARLERSLVNYAMDTVSKRGFELIYVPDVLNSAIPKACGLMQRSESGILYVFSDNPDLCLSGTSEMGIASYLENKTFDLSELPLKLMALSRCYRPEVDVGTLARGLYRVHEFTKLEMFVVTADENGLESDQTLQQLLEIQTEIFESLGLRCRVLNMSSEELGAAAYQKFDIEAWIPSRKVHGELSSASNCTDFQSRRLNVRYKRADGSLNFVHTCNGTACATTRVIIALLEQGQHRRGGFHPPAVLKKYLKDDKRRPGLKMKKNDMRNRFYCTDDELEL